MLFDTQGKIWKNPNHFGAKTTSKLRTISHGFPVKVPVKPRKPTGPSPVTEVTLSLRERLVANTLDNQIE
jgi:hypothetical protein